MRQLMDQNQRLFDQGIDLSIQKSVLVGENRELRERPEIRDSNGTQKTSPDEN